MMTRKDFDNLAKEIAWYMYLNAQEMILVLTPDTKNEYLAASNTYSHNREYNTSGMISAVICACFESNQKFNAEKFRQAISDYIVKARSIGSGIFD